MNKYLSFLQTSITNFQILLLKYKSGQGVISEREIEPLAIYFEQGEWNLIAFCRLRNEHRNFLINRIHNLEETGKTFSPNLFSLKSYFNKF